MVIKLNTFFSLWVEYTRVLFVIDDAIMYFYFV